MNFHCTLVTQSHSLRLKLEKISVSLKSKSAELLHHGPHQFSGCKRTWRLLLVSLLANHHPSLCLYLWQGSFHPCSLLPQLHWGGVVVQWLAPSPHRKKVPGSSLSVSAGGDSRNSGFLSQPKDMRKVDWLRMKKIKCFTCKEKSAVVKLVV